MQDFIIYWFWPLLIVVGVLAYSLGCIVGAAWGAKNGVKIALAKVQEKGFSPEDLDKAYKEIKGRR